MSKSITIITEIDNQQFNTDSQLISKSGFVKNLLDQYPDEKEIKIPQIRGKIFKYVLEYLEKHRNEEPKLPPTPLRNYDLSEVIGKWEDDFIRRVYDNSFDNLFEMLNAVNFLDIPSLLELTSAFFACQIKDHTADEFKSLFKIEEDCTPDDLKKIEEEVLKEREIEREKERQRLEEEEKNRVKSD